MTRSIVHLKRKGKELATQRRRPGTHRILNAASSSPIEQVNDNSDGDAPAEAAHAAYVVSDVNNLTDGVPAAPVASDANALADCVPTAPVASDVDAIVDDGADLPAASYEGTTE